MTSKNYRAYAAMYGPEIASQLVSATAGPENGGPLTLLIEYAVRDYVENVRNSVLFFGRRSLEAVPSTAFGMLEKGHVGLSLCVYNLADQVGFLSVAIDDAHKGYYNHCGNQIHRANSQKGAAWVRTSDSYEYTVFKVKK